MKPLYKEKNTIYKRRYSYHIGILYPSTYQASLSSLGLQVIYYLLNSYREIYAERIVAEHIPPVSIETQTPLKKFDLILASASYELDYPTIIQLLMNAGIHPMRKNRLRKPYIIIGGPSPTANPEPLHEFADAVIRGEIEEIASEFISSLSYMDSRNKFLEEISKIKGTWVPETETNNGIAITTNLDKAYHPITQIQSLEKEPVWGKSLLVEPSRGCNRGCAFCLEGSITRPRRERSINTVINIIEEGLEVNALHKVAFYSLSFFDSNQGEKILDYLIEEKIEGSIPSVRADALTKEKILKTKLIGQKTITIAPETPVSRLQLILGKRIPEKQVINIAHWTKEYGLNLKLYYMIGIPKEEKSDLDAIIMQIEKIWSIHKNRERIRISINPFIPKPMTGLWHAPMEDVNILKKKILYIKSKISRIARIEYYNPKRAYIQYEINKAGRNAHNIIMKLARRKNLYPSLTNYGDA